MGGDPRTLRQLLLREIGPAGQARIAAATARVLGKGDGSDEATLAHEVSERYARGAGFGALEDGPIDIAALAPEDIVAAPGPRAVLAGARAALAEMRASLGVGAGEAGPAAPGQEASSP